MKTDQTGCKLLFYTEYGMRHVITSLVRTYVNSNQKESYNDPKQDSAMPK